MTLQVYYTLLSVQCQYGMLYNDISVCLCKMCIDISTHICYNVIVEMERKKANAKYNAKAYEQMPVRVPKGKTAIIQNHAEQNGESVNGFINRAIDETMERDKKDTESK